MSDRPAREALHAQSYGKDVGAVSTLLAQGALDPAPLDPVRAPAPDAALAALQGTRLGEVADAFPPADRVHAAAAEAVRVRRLAPLDRYPVHRAYPSPRGIFGADAHLVSATGTRLRVDPHDLTGRGPREQGGTPTAVVVSAHPDRYPHPYGTLRPSLALLESGHLGATVGLTASRAGLSPTVTFGSGDGSEVLRVHVGTGSRSVAALDAATAPTADTLREWLDRRSSGWSHENLVTSRPIPVEVTQGVTDALVLALRTVSDVVPGAGALRIYRHRLVGDSMSTREFLRVDAPGEPRVEAGGAPFAAATGYSLTADAEAWLARYGADATVVLHTVLGWIAQWGCLAGAADRLTVRPARNFDEADWSAALALPLGHTIAYQLWLRPWPADGDERTAWSLLGVDA